MHLCKSSLKIYYVLADWPAADANREEYISGLPGVGWPNAVYPALKGSTPGMDWPKGATPAPLDYAFSNTLVTDEADRDFGIRSWHITAEPGLVPGRLQVASYLDTNTDLSAPDFVDDYDLDVSGWDTGPLRVTASDGTHYTTAWLRWVPINLLSLL